MKLSILAVVSTVSCVAAVAACSSSSGNGFQTTPEGDSGTISSEGGTTDAGSESGGGALPYVGELTAAKEGTVFTITGAFFPTPTTTPTMPMCPTTGMSSGSCCYIPPAAASDAGTTDGGATAMAQSAGTILIKDGTANVAALNPLPNGGGYGVTSGANNPSVKWTPGDMLSISAAGGTVQAFSGSLTTVDDFAGVTPTLSTTATTISLGGDLAVSWTAGNGTTVAVTLIAFKGKAGDGLITCQVSDTGSTSVPGALLAKFTTGDTGAMSINRTNVTKITGPNASVELVGTTTSSGVVKYQ
jgi:hypothetical protein